MVSINTASRARYGYRFLKRPLALLTASVLVVVCVILIGFNTLQRTSAPRLIANTPSLRFRPDTASCRFFLAESAIPHGGLGLYTAIDIKKGDFAQSMADLCIYVADTPKGTDFETHSWARDVFNGDFEGKNPRAACEGFATLFNSMPPGVSTSKLMPQNVNTNAGLHRATHAGAGAISHYFGIWSKAIQDITAGAELTIDYGDFPYQKGKKYVAPKHDPAWLLENGMCIDNIKIQQAVDPQMGRGAFASRRLAKGQLVAPAPLQSFPSRKAFARQNPEALFVNYCFQPRGTDILLFPYGPGVNLINHSSQKTNVELRWSTNPYHHKEWLTVELDDYFKLDKPGGIILEVVATRDIAEGEELFLDYGSEWEQAWDQHAENWKPVDGADRYVYPEEMDNTEPVRTVEEQKNRPYPENLANTCFTPNWERDFGVMRWKQPDFDWPEGNVNCHILKREKNAKGDDEYEVSLNFDSYDYTFDPKTPRKKLYIDTHVPRSAIGWVEKAYTSDLHLKNAFRHTIPLPEHLVPPLWKAAIQ